MIIARAILQLPDADMVYSRKMSLHVWKGVFSLSVHKSKQQTLVVQSELSYINHKHIIFQQIPEPKNTDINAE